MSSLKRPGLLAVVLVFACAPFARADSLYNNLSAAPGGSDPIGASFGPLADSFSTGASRFSFDSLTVLLSGSSPTGTITAYLLSDSSTSPGAVLETIGTLSEASLSGSNALYTVSTSYTLAANTRYWIELASNDTDRNWSWSLDTSGTGVAGEYFANQEGTGIFGVFPNSEGPYQMDVSGTTIVPEPGSLMLLGAGLLVLGGLLAHKHIG